MRSKFVLALVLLLGAAHAARAQFRDPAGLMPPKVIAYADFRSFGQLMFELGNLLKGSALENVPDSLDKIRSKYKEKDNPDGLLRMNMMGAGVFGVAFSPEVRNEIGRLESVAAALIDIDDKGEPKYLAVAYPGSSNAPAFFMRAMLTTAPVRKVEVVEGVSLYAFETVMFVPKEGGDKKGEFKKVVKVGPTCAMVTQGQGPGMGGQGPLLIGSHEEVKDAIVRLKAKVKAPSLAQQPYFTQYRQFGLYVYADPAQIFPLLQKMPIAPSLEVVLKAINPAALRSYHISANLEPQGRFVMREILVFNPKEKSPLLELLPTRPADMNILQFAPKDAVLAAAMDNGNGEKRLQEFIALHDALAPKGFKLADGVAELEKTLKINLGKDVVGQITGVGFAMGDLLQMKIKTVERIGDRSRTVTEPGVPPLVLILQTTSDKAAENLIGLIPRLRDPKAPAPAKKEIEGREIFVMELGVGEEGTAFCYGRQGPTIVIGPYADMVARSLNNGAKRQGLLSSPQLATRNFEFQGRQAVVMVKPAHLIAGAAWSQFKVSGEFEDRAPGKKEKDENDKAPEKKEEKVKITYRSLLDDPMMKELSEIIKDEDFYIKSVQVQKDRIQIDAALPNLNKLVPKLVDFAVDSMYRDMMRVNEARPKEKEKEAPAPK